ncbi:hypothetical protein EG329_012546 [Mollisiaceae sp. DMI_Dod_QoI]|nr:hypothetical protein EG329_012546 [Helotiales sp. DMI_Dod_QoI]
MFDISDDVYDEVWNHLHTTEEIQTDSRDKIAAKLEFSKASSFDNWNPDADLYRGYDFLRYYRNVGKGKPDIESLKALRLTSRKFHRAASRVLFRSTCVKWQAAATSWIRASEGAAESSELCILRLAKHLQIDLSDWNGWEAADDFQNTGSILSKLFLDVACLSNLQSFEVNIPVWKGEFNQRESIGYAPQLDLNVLETFTKSLSQNLASPGRFEYLTDLRPSLPDATGPDGAREYLKYADEDGSGQDVFPLSNVQQLHPNLQYGYGVFNIVSRCAKLKSLCIEGTHQIDANVIIWEPNGGLEDLCLKRIRTSAETLISLLSPLAGEPSSILTLWLDGIEPTEGTWAEVFSHLKTCPSLSYLNPTDLGYSRDGESADFRPWSPWGGHHHEDCVNLWSLNEEDEDTLRKLVEELVAKAGGRDLYPNLFEEQLMLLDEDEYEEPEEE